MLCPEVWSFPLKQCTTSHQTGTYDKKAKQTLDKFIRSCPFNQMVTLVLPEAYTVPTSIEQLIESSDYYLIRKLRLCDLVRKDFLEAFIKRGSLTGISVEVGLFDKSQNVFAITSDGKLILSINKDLYQIIGLEGRTAASSKGTKDKFEIVIDLKDKNLSAESKMYSRVKCALSRVEIEPFDLQLSWEPIDNSVCPSSVAKFFNDLGYKVEQHSIVTSMTTRDTLKMPRQILSRPKVDSDMANALAEYLGMILLSCDTNPTNAGINSFTLDFDMSAKSAPSTPAIILHCKGLLTADFIVKLLESISLSADKKSFVFNVNVQETAPCTGSKGYTLFYHDNKYFMFKT